MSMPPEMRAECGCAYVLQTMTKRLRPTVKRAYDAPTHERRLELVREAIADAESVVAVLRSLHEDTDKAVAPASTQDDGDTTHEECS